MKSINDTIYETMLREERGLSSSEILTRFFRMRNIDESMAEKIVSPILLADARFTRDGAGTAWRALRIRDTDRVTIVAASFVLFCIEDTTEVRQSGTDLFSHIGKYASFIIRQGSAEAEVKDVKSILLDADRYIFVPYDAGSLNRLKRMYRTLSPLDPELKTLSVKRLISQLYPEKKIKKWQDLIREFSLLNFESHSPVSKTKTLMYVFEHITDTAVGRGAVVIDDLLEMSERPKTPVNFAQYAFDREFLKALPSSPGVYIFRNREGQAVYVGKTGNLKARVNSYFRDSEESVEKRALILRHLYSIEYSELGSDLEALIEEYRLIDEYIPVLNTKVNIPQRVVETPDTILVLPCADRAGLKLYFLSNTSPLIEYEFTAVGKGSQTKDAPRGEIPRGEIPGRDISGKDISGKGTPEGDAVREIIPKLKQGNGYVFDPLKIIAIGYWKRYDERLDTIDIDSFRSTDDIISILYRFLGEIERIGHEKIGYI